MSAFDFLLPDVGEGIAEAEVIEWLVGVGDEVTVDQVVAVIETDKSQIEMPIPIAGRVAAIHASPGDVVKVGSALITIAAVDALPASAAPEAAHNTVPAGRAAAAPIESSALLGRVLASPSTRKLAASLGVDITQVTGTGPQGRVTESDVRTANTGSRVAIAGAAGSAYPTASSSAVIAGGVTIVPLQGVRRAIAASMTAALQVPHILEFKEIDATALLVARDRLITATGTKVSITPLLVRACLVALQQHPTFNARFDVGAGEISQYASQHIGIATATDDGLIVPVLRDAQDVEVAQLAARIDALAQSAKTRTASPADLQGGTFTMTNFGSFGTWLGTPIIRTPEVAIAGFGRVADKVLVVDGAPAVRPVLPIVVAADHRVNDGAHLGAFVATLSRLLSFPAEMGA